jgi:DNA repair exonuclease SbcCD ATPase subunit
MYCGKCKSKMTGCSAKSGKYHYYVCNNYIKRGKNFCNTQLIKQEEIESLVIAQIAERILTEENITKLYYLVLDEINQDEQDLESRLQTIDRRLNSLKQGLDKLYMSLETGKLTADDLAPRISELRSQIDVLENDRNVMMDEINNPKVLPLTLNELKNYIRDLNGLLEKGTITERKAFLHSLIKRIIVNHPKIRLDYNFPIINEIGRTSDSEVLPMCKTGSPSWNNFGCIATTTRSKSQTSL